MNNPRAVFVSCGVVHPRDPDLECLSRKGHDKCGARHGIDSWPEGYLNGPPILIEWDDEGRSWTNGEPDVTPRDDDAPNPYSDHEFRDERETSAQP